MKSMTLLILLPLLLLPSNPTKAADLADAHVRSLADSYVKAYFEHFPERITLFGVPGLRQDKLRDNSLDGTRAWHDRENALLTEAKQINLAEIQFPSLRATYAIVREALEASIATRVCRDELWRVNQNSGWQVLDSYAATLQPVGTDVARQDALTRWSSLPTTSIRK
jgi:hypothetical protein